MKGAEHYTRAEELVDAAGAAAVSEARGYESPPGHIERLLSEAQVHATLALAAAMATTIPAEQEPGVSNRGIVGTWVEAGAL